MNQRKNPYVKVIRDDILFSYYSLLNQEILSSDKSNNVCNVCNCCFKSKALYEVHQSTLCISKTSSEDVPAKKMKLSTNFNTSSKSIKAESNTPNDVNKKFNSKKDNDSEIINAECSSRSFFNSYKQEILSTTKKFKNTNIKLSKVSIKETKDHSSKDKRNSIKCRNSKKEESKLPEHAHAVYSNNEKANVQLAMNEHKNENNGTLLNREVMNSEIQKCSNSDNSAAIKVSSMPINKSKLPGNSNKVCSNIEKGIVKPKWSKRKNDNICTSNDTKITKLSNTTCATIRVLSPPISRAKSPGHAHKMGSNNEKPFGKPKKTKHKNGNNRCSSDLKCNDSLVEKLLSADDSNKVGLFNESRKNPILKSSLPFYSSGTSCVSNESLLSSIINECLEANTGNANAVKEQNQNEANSSIDKILLSPIEKAKSANINPVHLHDNNNNNNHGNFSVNGSSNNMIQYESNGSKHYRIPSQSKFQSDMEKVFLATIQKAQARSKIHKLKQSKSENTSKPSHRFAAFNSVGLEKKKNVNPISYQKQIKTIGTSTFENMNYAHGCFPNFLSQIYCLNSKLKQQPYSSNEVSSSCMGKINGEHKILQKSNTVEENANSNMKISTSTILDFHKKNTSSTELQSHLQTTSGNQMANLNYGRSSICADNILDVRDVNTIFSVASNQGFNDTKGDNTNLMVGSDKRLSAIMEEAKTVYENLSQLINLDKNTTSDSKYLQNTCNNNETIKSGNSLLETFEKSKNVYERLSHLLTSRKCHVSDVVQTQNICTKANFELYGNCNLTNVCYQLPLLQHLQIGEKVHNQSVSDDEKEKMLRVLGENIDRMGKLSKVQRQAHEYTNSINFKKELAPSISKKLGVAGANINCSTLLCKSSNDSPILDNASNEKKSNITEINKNLMTSNNVVHGNLSSVEFSEKKRSSNHAMQNSEMCNTTESTFQCSANSNSPKLSATSEKSSSPNNLNNEDSEILKSIKSAEHLELLLHLMANHVN